MYSVQFGKATWHVCPLSAYCAEVSSVYAASLCIYSAGYCNTAVVGLCSFLCGKPALMQGQTGLHSEPGFIKDRALSQKQINRTVKKKENWERQQRWTKCLFSQQLDSPLLQSNSALASLMAKGCQASVFHLPSLLVHLPGSSCLLVTGPSRLLLLAWERLGVPHRLHH